MYGKENSLKEQRERNQAIANEIFAILKDNHLTVLESDMVLEELKHIIRNRVRM